jgi:ethanolamine utilization protein EutP
MKQKRIMLIGPSGSGKTSLANALNGCQGRLGNTQTITYGNNTIDVPGSYIENTGMYKHIIATAQHASHMLVLIDQSKCTEMYSPGFAKAFRIPVIGVITKCDLNEENLETCIRQLKRIGISEPWFLISVQTGRGTEALKEHLLKTSSQGEAT